MAKGDVFAEDLVSVTNIYKSLVFDCKKIQKIGKDKLVTFQVVLHPIPCTHQRLHSVRPQDTPMWIKDSITNIKGRI